MVKWVYTFGDGKAQGNAKQKELLGGKGANLAEMCNLAIPVPPGFTISTEVCTYYMKHKKYPPGLKNQVNNALQKIDGHQHDCGRTGINGGYMKNDKARFGVNCYGYKPEITPEERENMGNNPAYPLTKKELMFNDKVASFRKHLPDILISPFNSNQWSQI